MTSPFATICFFIVYETIRFHIAVSVEEEMPDDVKLWSSVTLGCASCATFLFLPCAFDGICEGNYISITNPCSFWPIPRVLVSQTERNRQRQNRSGVVKKRVRFGSSREKKKLITQHDPPLPRFFHSSVTLTQFNMALRFTTN